MKRSTAITPRAVAVLTVVALLTGIVVGGFFGSDSGEGQQLIADDQQRGRPESRTVEDAEVTGVARSSAGAVTAAAAYVTNGQTLLDLPPTQLPEAVRRFAAAETADQQLADLNAELGALRELLSGGQGRTRYLQAVLAARVEVFSEERARVSLWSVGILWRRGAADPQAGWTTSTLDLVWEHDTWKVWAETITSGPAPAPNGGTPPVDAAELDRILVGFEPWSAVR